MTGPTSRSWYAGRSDGGKVYGVSNCRTGSHLCAEAWHGHGGIPMHHPNLHSPKSIVVDWLWQVIGFIAMVAAGVAIVAVAWLTNRRS